MAWTTTAPTKEGWYWHRDEETFSPVRVIIECGRLCACFPFGNKLAEMVSGEWWGEVIQPPPVDEFHGGTVDDLPIDPERIICVTDMGGES